ncbi:MAG: hypothetical protein R3E68_21450 [Burkholderiaceae bacterium]
MCVGAYVAAGMASAMGTTDIFLLSLIAVVVTSLLGMLLGPLLSTYRGIFFAVLLSVAVDDPLRGTVQDVGDRWH